MDCSPRLLAFISVMSLLISLKLALVLDGDLELLTVALDLVDGLAPGLTANIVGELVRRCAHGQHASDRSRSCQMR